MLNPVTVEVIRNSLPAAANEMARARRSAEEARDARVAFEEGLGK